MTPPTSRTVAFGAAQIAQGVFGVGVLDCVRTLAYALPYDERQAGWDWSMWMLYVTGTHRFWVYALGALLLTLQFQAFRSTSKHRDATILLGMSATTVLLVVLFANGLFVALRLDQPAVFLGAP